jgi:hypothetical protein
VVDAPALISEPARRPAALPALLAAAAALAVFAVTLGGSCVYDDLFMVKLDPRVGDVSRWGEYWTRDYFNGGMDNLYRPLVSMSYAIQWQLHGDRPWAFHLVNWLLHAACSAAVAELGRRLAGWRVGLIAGLLFAVHPVHVEAVAAVVGRAELMCALATITALLLFLHHPMTTGRALAIWACGVVALLSKEQGMLLPLMLAALWLLHRRSDEPSAQHTRSMRLLVLLILWTWAGYLILREQVLGLRFWWDRGFLDWTQNPLVRSSGADRWLMPAALLGRYAALLVTPHRLSPDYGALAIGSHTSLQDPYLLAGLAVAGISLAALVISLIHGNRVFAFALVGLGLSYGIVSNLPAIIGTIFAERLMYMPSAFFVLIAGLALARCRPAWLAPLLILATTAWAVQSVRYARLWNDPVELLEQSIENQPGAIRLYILLAEEQARCGDYAASDQAMARARQLIPDYAYVWYRSALMAADRGDFDAARNHLAEAMRLDPGIIPPGVSKMIREGKSPLTESRKP